MGTLLGEKQGPLEASHVAEMLEQHDRCPRPPVDAFNDPLVEAFFARAERKMDARQPSSACSRMLRSQQGADTQRGRRQLRSSLAGAPYSALLRSSFIQYIDQTPCVAVATSTGSGTKSAR